MTNILVLFFSQHNNCQQMADLVARGVENVADCNAIARTVPPIKASNDPNFTEIPDDGAPYATLSDLEQADGLCLGAPTHFGNMPAALKHFWDQTTGLWLSGALNKKPAGVFTSTGSLHGGQETTLLTMMIPLLHHGMIITGLPYSEEALLTTRTGGTPYGPSHLAGTDGSNPISDEEKQLCIALGKRVAALAKQLATPV